MWPPLENGLGTFFPLLTLFIPATGNSFCFLWIFFAVWNFKLWCYGPSAWLMNTFSGQIPANLTQTMASNTQRLVNGKLLLQTKFQPSFLTHEPNCYGSSSLMFHKHLKLTTFKTVTFFFPSVTAPTVFLTSTWYLPDTDYPRSLLKYWLRRECSTGSFLTSSQSMLMPLMEDHWV